MAKSGHACIFYTGFVLYSLEQTKCSISSEDWMELAQDRGRWRALVSTVMNLRVPKMRGIS